MVEKKTKGDIYLLEKTKGFTLQSIYLNVTIKITGNVKNMEKRLENVEEDIIKLNDKMEEILTTMRQLKGKGTDSDSNTNIQKISDKVEANSKQIMQVSLKSYRNYRRIDFCFEWQTNIGRTEIYSIDIYIYSLET